MKNEIRAIGLTAALVLWAVTVPAANVNVVDDTTYALTNAGSTATGNIVGATTEMVAGGAVGSSGNGRTIWGGQSSGGNAIGNRLTISGGRVWTSGGGSMGGTAYGGWAISGSAGNNVVTMSGGQVDDQVIGGMAAGDAVNNRVTISEADGTVWIGANGGDGEVVGGSSRNGSATGNTVTISAGTIVGGVVGGSSDSSNTAHSASNNTVTITGGSIGESVVGGTADAGNASGNTVEITGGSVDELIVGGFSSSGNATGNTVRLGGGASVSQTNTGIYGGLGGADVKTGNTLYLDGFRGSVREINNFQHYNFHLPSGMADGDTLVTITGTATDMTGSSVDAITLDAASTLDAGHSVVLISNAAGAFAATSLQAVKGATLLIDATVSIEAGQLVATFGGSGSGGGQTSVNPQGKALAQSRVGGLVMLGQGADLVADSLFVNAARGAAYREGGAGPVFFSAFSYADQRVKTGSHVDADGWSLLAGLAWRANADASGWMGGAFFETGRGSYDGYNSFSTAPRVHSSGDLKYHGGGLMGSFRFLTGTRIEASVRAGRLETDYRADGFAGGLRPRYDLDSTYYGSHFGVGQEIDVTHSLSLDLSAKYLWTRQQGKSVAILGERTRFDSVDSQRLRAGGRLAYTGCVVSPYAGVFFEYEFDGKARTANRATGVRYASPTTRGATYTGELGVRFTPARCLDVDLSVRGHAGRRDGVSGRLAVGLSF